MKMTPALDSLMDRLADAEALLLEPQECFNKALIGIAERGDGILVAAYDEEKCIQAIARHNGWDHDEALEWFEFNTKGGYVGEKSPVFVETWVLE